MHSWATLGLLTSGNNSSWIKFSCESNRIVVRDSTFKFLLSEIHLPGVTLLSARDLHGPSTVNDLIDAHSQINPSYLINTPLYFFLLRLY